MMRLLIFGKSGQVARELQRRAAEGIAVHALGREEADLSDPAACVAAITAHRPDAIINAAAFTGVDPAEKAEALATVINGAAPAAMARAAAEREVPFLHISTDYVFDGSGSAPWTVDAPTAPLGAYGRSKLAGEVGVRGAGGQYAILRTSWVFSAHGSNFVKTMLRLSQTRDRLEIVADQVGGPTPAAAIADALLAMSETFFRGNGRSGTYHFAGAPDVSWADFAREIFARAGRDTRVEDIATSGFPTPAQRPANSRLDCTSLARVFGIERPDWHLGLTAVLDELAEQAT